MFHLFKNHTTECKIYSPVDGLCIPIEQVNDPTFAGKLLGEGIAFVFASNTLYSPCHGRITMIAKTKHAIGFQCHNKADILLHIGLDTVTLAGQGFHILKKVGDTVKVGEPILTIDQEFMKINKIDLTTPIIITNTNQYHLIFKNINKTIHIGDEMITMIKK